VLKVVIGQPQSGALQPFVDAASSRDDLEVVGVTNSGRETADALRNGRVDALVFPDDWAELCRAIRVSLGLTSATGPSFVVGAQTLTAPLIVKSALYGFDGAVPALSAPSESVGRLVDIAHGSSHLTDEPLVRELGIRSGALARKVSLGDSIDREIADLLATGLTDDHIARVLSTSIQHVRNRIEQLLHSNGLTHRTQLAVLKAALWEAPDFS